MTPQKPVLVFSLASAGMGHATRDVPILKRLSQKYEVHIFCSTMANAWLKTLLELPKSFAVIFRIAAFLLKHRPVAVISDFEAHSVYATWLT